MKRRFVYFLMLAIVASSVVGCSRRGVHMPKHRKKRHCNCPTFSECKIPQHTVMYGDLG